jgi:hypothetical protein
LVSHSFPTRRSSDLEDVLDEVAKSMNTEEKEIIDEIKKALHWK